MWDTLKTTEKPLLSHHIFKVIVVSHVVVVVNLVRVPVAGLVAHAGRLIGWVVVLHLLKRYISIDFIILIS